MLKFSDKDFRANITEIFHKATTDTWGKKCKFSKEIEINKNKSQIILRLKNAVPKERETHLMGSMP